MTRDNRNDAELKQLDKQANLHDLVNDRVLRKYERKKHDSFNVEEKDREKISQIFDTFKARTGDKNVLISKALRDLADEFIDDEDFQKEIDVLKDYRHANGQNIDSSNSDLDDVVQKMLFNNRLNCFQSKTECFNNKAKVMQTKLKTIGATITKGTESEEQKNLYEDLMRKFILDQILKKKVVQPTKKRVRQGN